MPLIRLRPATAGTTGVVLSDRPVCRFGALCKRVNSLQKEAGMECSLPRAARSIGGAVVSICVCITGEQSRQCPTPTGLKPRPWSIYSEIKHRGRCAMTRSTCSAWRRGQYPAHQAAAQGDPIVLSDAMWGWWVCPTRL